MDRSWGIQTAEAPGFQDNQHMKVVRGCQYYVPAAFTRRKYSRYSFLLQANRHQGHSAAGRIMQMKNSDDTIGNRTRDLPACSTVYRMWPLGGTWPTTQTVEYPTCCMICFKHRVWTMNLPAYDIWTMLHCRSVAGAWGTFVLCVQILRYWRRISHSGKTQEYYPLWTICAFQLVVSVEVESEPTDYAHMLHHCQKS
jgi:hypothetical protein